YVVETLTRSLRRIHRNLDCGFYVERTCHADSFVSRTCCLQHAGRAHEQSNGNLLVEPRLHNENTRALQVASFECILGGGAALGHDRSPVAGRWYQADWTGGK